MKNNIVVMLDLIRVINILNLSLLGGIVLSKMGVNQYIVFIAVMLCGILLTNVTHKAFVKKYGRQSSFLGNLILTIITLILNLLIISYFIPEREYIFIALMIAFFLCSSLLTRRKAEKSKQMKWRIQNV